MFWATIAVCVAVAFVIIWRAPTAPGVGPTTIPVRAFLTGLLAVQLGTVAAILVLFVYALVVGHPPS